MWLLIVASLMVYLIIEAGTLFAALADALIIGGIPLLFSALFRSPIKLLLILCGIGLLMGGDD